MGLEIFGLTGIKLYLAMIVALTVVVCGGYTVLGLGAEPFSLSDDDEDTFSVDNVDDGRSLIAFTSTPSGATVKINDRTYTTPTSAISLSPGAYDYVASLDGYISKGGTANAEDGKSLTLDLSFQVSDDTTTTPTATPTDGATPTGTDTTTPTGTPTVAATAEPDEIPYGGVDVRVTAGTAFQGVKNAGVITEDEWDEIAGKRLYLTDDNTIKLTQVSGWPNGVGTTVIEYNTDVPTRYNEFESEYTYGSNIDFRLEYTGSSSSGLVGDVLIGYFYPPGINQIDMRINVVPKTYGFLIAVNKRDGEGPVIVKDFVYPVAISTNTWSLASIASWDPFTQSAIDVAVGPAQGNFDTTYPIYEWAFWGTVVDSNHDWIGGETPAVVIVRASDVDNHDTPGTKVMYVRLIDNEQILPESASVAYYRIDYTVTTGNIVVDDVTKI